MAEKVRDLLDLSSLRLTAPPCDGAKFPASLSVGVWENKPQFTLRTGVQSLPRYGLFSISLYPIEFQMVLEGLIEFANMPFVEGEKVNNALTVFDKVGNDAKEIGDIVYGRDDKGKMFICLVSTDSNFPKVVFYITPPRKFKLKGASDVQASALYAKAYAAFWQNTMTEYLMKNFIDTSGNNQRGGQQGGGGGGYNNNNQGGGYNNNNQGGGQQQQQNDDVIPC